MPVVEQNAWRAARRASACRRQQQLRSPLSFGAREGCGESQQSRRHVSQMADVGARMVMPLMPRARSQECSAPQKATAADQPVQVNETGGRPVTAAVSEWCRVSHEAKEGGSRADKLQSE